MTSALDDLERLARAALVLLGHGAFGDHANSQWAAYRAAFGPATVLELIAAARQGRGGDEASQPAGEHDLREKVEALVKQAFQDGLYTGPDGGETMEDCWPEWVAENPEFDAILAALQERKGR